MWIAGMLKLPTYLRLRSPHEAYWPLSLWPWYHICLTCLFAQASQFSLVIAHGFWATVCKTVRPMLSVCCLSCPVCLSVTFVHCGQTVGWIKTKLGTRVGFGPGHFVLDGDPVPYPMGLRLEFRNWTGCAWALPVVANFVALEQQIILVRTRRESV